LKKDSLPPSSLLNTNGAEFEFDIIPVFTATLNDRSTTTFPGKNLDASYGGVKGSQVLADGCEILGTTEAIPVVVTEPASVVPLVVTETDVNTVVQTVITVQEQTVTAPGATTMVTVSGGTTTVTTPGSTVRLPARTVTGPGYTATQPTQTVTLPGDTQTITAAGTTTVTLTTPTTRFVRGGLLATRIRVALLRLRQAVRVRLRRRLIRVVLRQRQRAAIVIVVRTANCPAGTRIFNGRCAEIAHGKG
jgi:hypothetical protein